MSGHPAATNGRHLLELLALPDGSDCHVQFVTPKGTHDSSFGELWSLSTRMGAAVQATLPSGRVAGVLTPSPQMVAGFVGAMRAGRDFVSIPLPGRGQDAMAYAQQLRAIVEIAGVGALVVEASYAGLLQSLPGGLPCPIIEAERLAEATTDELRTEGEPGELVQFSSGTTGTPKGIRLSGAAIAASIEATLDGLGVGGQPESFCAWVPLSHDMGLIGGLLGSWVGCRRTRPGYRYTCISPELFLARPMLWMETCAAIGATVTAGPTFAYHLMSRQLPRARPLGLASLRACIVGAEPIGPETLRAFADAASPHGLRENTLCPGYGLAEMGLVVSMVAPGEPWTTRTVSVDGRSNDYVSCGRVLHCATVDAPDVGAGAGPIRVSGPARCGGYLPARAARPGGWLDTGDLGVMSGGELIVTGRSDDLLCVAGRNLFAWELERAASAAPQVRPGNCAVVTDGRGRYVVLFERRATGDGDAGDTLADVRLRVTKVAGIGPSAVGCLPQGGLAKTPSGKIRRNLIAADLGRLIDTCTAYREF